jgi:hypothetical protein
LTQIARASEREYQLRLMAGMIPAGVGQDERADRLAECESLIRKSQAAADGTIRQAYDTLSQAMLMAPPRDQLERRASAYVAKAAVTADAAMAADFRRRADELRELCAPRRQRFDPAAVIRKAKADAQMLACFDQAGKLYGVCDPDDVELVDGGDPGQPPAGQVPPAGQALPGGVPGAQVAKGSGRQMRAVFDQQHRLIGMIDPDRVTPVITTVPGAKEAIGKAYAGGVAKARGARVAKTVPAGHVTAYDEHGRFMGYVRPGDLTDPAAMQARDAGPVQAGGTTGLGQPRNTPQQRLPGDAQTPGRQIVKAARRPLR